MPNAAGKTYQPHIRVQWGGFLGNNREDIWSNSVGFHNGGTPLTSSFLMSRGELVDSLPAVWQALSDWMGRPDSGIHTSALLDFLKVNVILENGKQRDLETVGRQGVGSRGGGSGNTPLPWQMSYCLTLRSDTFTRGRGHSGRVFPPMTTVPIGQGSPYCTQPAALLMAESFRDCLNGIATGLTEAVNGPDITAYHPAIISPGDTNRGTTGLNANIDRVICDRLPDIQRRRVNNVQRSEGAPALIEV